MARWVVGEVDGRKGAREAENGQMWGERWKNEGVKRVGRVVLGVFCSVFRGISPLMERMVRVWRGVQLHGERVAALGGWLHGV